MATRNFITRSLVWLTVAHRRGRERRSQRLRMKRLKHKVAPVTGGSRGIGFFPVGKRKKWAMSNTNERTITKKQILQTPRSSDDLHCKSYTTRQLQLTGLINFF